LINDNCGIYKITSPSGKCYIGSSKNISSRLVQHKSSLRDGKHHNKHLQNAYNKYDGNFTYETLVLCPEQDRKFIEQQYLILYKPAYNIAEISDATEGLSLSQEARDNMKDKRKPVSESTKKKLSDSRKRYLESEEYKERREKEIQERADREEYLKSLPIIKPKKPRKIKGLSVGLYTWLKEHGNSYVAD